MLDKLILALDLGSTQLKLMLMNAQAEVVYLDSEPYPTRAKAGGMLEQDPSDWEQALSAGMKKMRQKVDLTTLEGISFSGHMSGVVLIDAEGNVLRPCIMLSDSRSTQECEDLNKKIGSVVREKTGNAIINAFSLPKLLWIKRNEPDIWEKTSVWLAPKDYLRFILTGVPATEYTDAYNSLCFDSSTANWCEEIIEAAVLDTAKFPRVFSPFDCAGTVTSKAADRFSIPAGVRVYAGGADMACGTLGMGLFETGTSALTLGTCATFLAPVDKPCQDYFGEVTYHLHAIPGLFYALGSHFNGGMVVNWIASLLNENDQIDYTQIANLSKAAEKVEPGCDGVMTIPFLVGSGSPYFNEQDRLNVLGANASTGKSALFRSLIEGVTLNLYQTKAVFDQMTPDGLKRIYLGGGGCKIPLWPQVIADVFDAVIHEATNADASTIGAAIIAGIGAGVFDDAKETAEKLLEIRRELTPDEKAAVVYRRLYQRYLRAVLLLREVNKDV